MRYFLLISLIALSLLVYPFSKSNQIVEPKLECITNNADSTGLYTISINISDNNFSGLLLFKKNNDSTIRAVMLSEMGPKILDIDLMPSSYKVNFAIKQLRRKFILKALYADFAGITGISTYRKPLEIIITDSLSIKSCKLSSNKIITYSTNSKSSNICAQIIDKQKKEAIIFYFCKEVNSCPDSIFLQHCNFNMDIRLKKIIQ
jgi:hypothetical protein